MQFVTPTKSAADPLDGLDLTSEPPPAAAPAAAPAAEGDGKEGGEKVEGGAADAAALLSAVDANGNRALDAQELALVAGGWKDDDGAAAVMTSARICHQPSVNFRC